MTRTRYDAASNSTLSDFFDAPKAKKARTYRFSASSLKLIRECRRCFWMRFNKGLKRPEGIFPSLPGGMDRILKDHFDRFRDRHELPPELRQLEGYRLFENTAKLDEWRDWRKGLSWKDANGNGLSGALDNLLVRGEKLVVLDYKTRGSAPNQETSEYSQDQLNIYNFLLEQNGFETEDHAFLLFYFPDKVAQGGDVIFHTQLVKMQARSQHAQELVSDALDLLLQPEPEPEKDCAYCAWQKLT